jgi:hypothetical protein
MKGMLLTIFGAPKDIWYKQVADTIGVGSVGDCPQRSNEMSLMDKAIMLMIDVVDDGHEYRD